MSATYKNCPFCKEQIRAEAVKCRFCGEWLEGDSPVMATTPASRPLQVERAQLPEVVLSPQIVPPLISASPPRIRQETPTNDGSHCWICGGDFGKRKPKSVYGYRACRGCYSSFANRRCLAYFVDNFVTWILIPTVLTLVVVETTNIASADRIISMGLFTLFFFSIANAAVGDFGASFAVMTWCLLIAWFLKDGLDGRSLGKRLLNLQVVDVKLDKPAGYKASFKRSLPLLLPLAPLFAGFQCGSGRRLGDYWAGTRVIWNKNREGFLFAIANEHFSTEESSWIEEGAKLEVNGKLSEAMAIYEDVACRHKATSVGEEAERCMAALKTKMEKATATAHSRDSSLHSE